ncbi:MAG: hypothetical protein OEW77_08980 [Gemmatimonadota bacterium]|nr:hypothetical protein [Gemmatimonadota bacterium]
MKIPLIVWIAAWGQLVPLAAALARPRVLREARLGVAVWLFLMILMDAVSWTWSIGLGRGNNHWVSFAFVPFQGVAVLWAIALWQVRPLLRLTLRLCVPLLLIWWAVDIALLEPTDTFSGIGSPVNNILILAASMLTLATRARDTDAPLLRQDWLWILAGLAIFFATNASVTIVQGASIASGDYALAIRAGNLKAALDICAYLLLTGGFLWAPRLTSSGDSSSRAPSPPSSPSSPSWRPS